METNLSHCEPPARNASLGTSINPATGEINGTFPMDTIADLFAAVTLARKAQPDWAAVPVRQRSRRIMRCAHFIQEHALAIATAICRDNGKTIGDAMATECAPAAMATGYYCKNAARFLMDQRIRPGHFFTINKVSTIVRVPFGVVGVISPWNYPFAIPYSEIIMGLLAGNAVILKTASETPMVGQMLTECIAAAGLPHGLFTHIRLPGKLAGDAFIDAGVDKLFFTGSVPVGKYLMKKAADRLTPLVLELGGNDPMIVCEDADLHRAADGAVWAGMQNAGQSCGGVERIYVHRRVYPEYLALLKQRVESLRVGNGQRPDMDVGAMTTLRQMAVVQAHVEDALQKGARIHARSEMPERSNGQFLPCMVLTEVNHTMAVMREETFGPVVGVMPFDTIAQAIALANDASVGLNGSVWSRNRAGALRIARQLQAGSVMINDHLMSHGLAETPWGGIKESGIGRTHGALGFSEMTWPQVVINDILPMARRNFWWHPLGMKQFNGMQGMIDSLYGNRWATRISGLYRMARAFITAFDQSRP